VDRAYRAERVELAGNGVLLLDGALLLGRWLPAELTVHLRMSAAALTRRLDPEWHWALPAYARYDAEHDPGGADVAGARRRPGPPGPGAAVGREWQVVLWGHLPLTRWGGARPGSGW